MGYHAPLQLVRGRCDAMCHSRARRVRRSIAPVESPNDSPHPASPMGEPLTQQERARAFLAEGRAREAEALLAEIVALDTRDGEAFRDLGLARVALADPAGAIDAF